MVDINIFVWETNIFSGHSNCEWVKMRKKNSHLPVASGVGYSPVLSPSAKLAFTVPKTEKEIGDYTNLFSRCPA